MTPSEKLKPAAPASVHLLLAALLWTTVGGLMAFFGVRWVLAGAGPHTWVLLTGALLVGGRSVQNLDRGHTISQHRGLNETPVVVLAGLNSVPALGKRQPQS